MGPPMCPSPAPELHTPITDTHTLPTTTARDPLMLNQRLMLMPTMDTTDTELTDHTDTMDTELTDMDTHTDTTERDLLIPPSSTTPTDMVPLVPTPMVLPLMADTEFCHTEVLPPPTTLWDTL